MIISLTDPKLPSAATTDSPAFSLLPLLHIPVISTLEVATIICLIQLEAIPEKKENEGEEFLAREQPEIS